VAKHTQSSYRQVVWIFSVVLFVHLSQLLILYYCGLMGVQIMERKGV
jgi:hypothetical protein